MNKPVKRSRLRDIGANARKRLDFANVLSNGEGDGEHEHEGDASDSFVNHYHLVDNIIEVTGMSPSPMDETANVLSDALNMGFLKQSN